MPDRLRIHIGQAFPEPVRRLIQSSLFRHDLIFPEHTSKSNLVAAGRNPAVETAHIAFGQPHPDDILASKTLRWVALSTAGYTRYDREDLRNHFRDRGMACTNASSVYDEPCAQHALALLLALARKLPDAIIDQSKNKSWPYKTLRAKSRLIGPKSTILLVGYGAIGRRLVELLSPFGANVIAFRRTVRGDENARTLSIDTLDSHLPAADAVINILPASESTKHFLNANRLSKMKSNAWLINIGRGSTVDQPALIDALNSNRLAAAFLDVTSPEPLPPTDPLWQAANCYITPHTAGGFDGEYQRQADHFIENVRRFEAGQPLIDRVY